MEGTILIVDDEVKITEILKAYLESNGFCALVAYDGRNAIESVRMHKPDLVILDLMLPDIPGEEVCRMIREESSVPIIMLTAKVEESDMVEGLGIGADDYIMKPFSPRNVIARIKAVLRRYRQDFQESSRDIVIGDKYLVVNFEQHTIYKNGNEVHLTPNEYHIFEAMVLAPNRVFTREQLVTCAWGDDYDGYDRSIDSHIKSIRQKIEPDRSNPRYFITVFGIGYKFVP